MLMRDGESSRNVGVVMADNDKYIINIISPHLWIYIQVLVSAKVWAFLHTTPHLFCYFSFHCL